MPTDRIKSRVPLVYLWSVRFSVDERQSLIELYERGDLKSRRLAVDYLETGSRVRHNRRFIFEMCDRMIPDRSTYVRWQSFLILGEYVETHPEQLWPLVLKWGTVTNRDIRAGVACCVLEHILEYHFVPYFDRALAYIEQGNRRFAYTLAYCSKFVQAKLPENSARLDAFVKKYFPRWKK